MRLLRFAPLLALAALEGPATSQEKAPAPQASPEMAATPAKKLEALKARFEKERQDAYDAYVEATTEEEKKAIIAGMPGKNYIPEFRAVAEEAAGTDTAAQAWLWILRLGVDPKESWEIVELLLSDHMRSPAMEELAGHVSGSAHEQGETRVVEALRAIVGESPHERVRAAAMFSLGTALLASKKPESKAEGRDCLEAVIAEYGGLSRRGDGTFAAAAAGFLYELDNLQIGMPAPDFATVDENGAPWKLSDYEGKVVVVDFWGFW